MKLTRHLAAAAALAATALVGIPAAATAAECAPTAGQEYIAPTYAVEHEYTHTTPGTPPVLGEPPLIAPAVDAWDETVVVTPAWTETVQHPAETKTIEHPAQTRTERLYRQWVTGKEKWSHVDLGWGWIDQGCTRETVTKPAWTETVTVKPAWTETIEHPAVTDVVHHDATPAVYGDAPVITPGTDAITELVWRDAGWRAPDDTYTPTGNTRTGEGITEMIDPGQEYVAPVICEDEPPVEEPTDPGDPEQPADPTTPADPTDPGTNVPTDPAPVDNPTEGEQGDDTPVVVTNPVVVAAPQTPAAAQPATPTARADAVQHVELAHTGVGPAVAAGIGVALVAAGGVILAARRTRTTS